MWRAVHVLWSKILCPTAELTAIILQTHLHICYALFVWYIYRATSTVSPFNQAITIAYNKLHLELGVFVQQNIKYKYFRFGSRHYSSRVRSSGADYCFDDVSFPFSFLLLSLAT